MPKRSRKVQPKRRPKRQSPAKKKIGKRTKKPTRDVNQMAHDLVKRLEDLGGLPEGKNPIAVLLGRRGGLKGGRARAAGMSDEQRAASASKAAQARWSQKKP